MSPAMSSSGRASPFGAASFGITASNLFSILLETTAALRPCDRLSRPPRQVVTPATTAAPSHPWPVGRRCAQPGARRWPRRSGQARGGSSVHLLIARRRRHPTRPLRHRRGYPAARHPGLPSVPPTCRGVPRLRNEGRRVRVASGPDPPGSSRCVFKRRRTSVSRVYLSVTLATPASSGSTDTSWLCRGRLPPTPAPPGTGCPQLHRPAATGRRQRSLTSTQSTSASRRTGGKTHLPWASRRLAVICLGRSGRVRRSLRGRDARRRSGGPSTQKNQERTVADPA